MKRFVRTNIGDIRTSATLIVEVFSFIHTCYAMDILIIGKVRVQKEDKKDREVRGGVALSTGTYAINT
ncbi:hypothetical protein FRY77_27440 [Halomonas sp. MG34]|nr:hypothetical protein [Halomonas sp. MG34]